MKLRTFNLFVGSAMLASVLAAHAETPSENASPASSESSASGGDESDMEEIVVTARRREESLQDVPISISVFSQEDLNSRNITSSQDLGRYVPSLSVDSQFSGDAQSFSLRGFFQELSSTPTVGVYFADAPAPRGGTVSGTTSGDGVGAGQMFDLQNVQVLKGPQGTLFGRNTTGGTILLVPAKPTGEFGGYVDVGVGNHGMDRQQGVINLPLAETVRTRFGFDRMQRDGWQNNISGIGPSKMNETDYYALRGSLVVDITPTLENYTVANFSVSNPVPGVNFVPDCNPSASLIPGYSAMIAAAGACQAQVARQSSRGFNTVQNGLSDTYQKTSQWQVVNTTTWWASDTVSLKNVASYAVFVNRYRGSIFGEYLNLDPNNPVFQPEGEFAAAGSSIAPGSQFIISYTSNAPGENNADQRTMSEEIQLHGKAFDSRLEWQTGLYAERSDPRESAVSAPVQAAACTSTSPALCGDPFGATLTDAYGVYVPQGQYSLNTFDVHFRDYGVYGQASYALLHNLTLTAGLRYTWDEMSGDASLINFYFPQGAGATAPSVDPVCFLPNTTTAIDCRTSSDSSSSAPTGVIDLEYKPIDRAMLYAKYSRGYRQGGIQPRSAIASYERETIDAYELGAKTSYGVDNFAGTLDLAAFYNKLSNQQLQVSYLVAGAFNQSLVNIGASNIYGLELDSAMRIYRDLRLDVSAAYLHTEIVEIGNADQVEANLPAALQPFFQFASGPTLHAPLPNSAKWRVSATASYDLPIPTNYGEPNIGLTMVYTADQYFTNPDGYTPPGGQPNYLPSHTLFNTNFSWRSIGNSPIDLNIFCTNLFDKEYIVQYLGGYNSVGFESARQGEPRMFGARIAYRFGAMRDN